MVTTKPITAKTLIINPKPFEWKDNTVLKISSKISTFVKNSFLIGCGVNITKVFRHAYLLKKVHWEKIFCLYKLWGGYTPPNTFVKTANEVFSEINEFITVIPFTPKINEQKKEIQSWEVKKFFSKTGCASSRFINKELSNIILSRADDMQILLNGKTYDNPCQFCKNLFSRIAGECPIAFKDIRHNLHSCQPRLIWRNDIIGDDINQTEGTSKETQIENLDAKELYQCLDENLLFGEKDLDSTNLTY